MTHLAECPLSGQLGRSGGGVRRPVSLPAVTPRAQRRGPGRRVTPRPDDSLLPGLRWDMAQVLGRGRGVLLRGWGSSPTPHPSEGMSTQRPGGAAPPARRGHLVPAACPQPSEQSREGALGSWQPAPPEAPGSPPPAPARPPLLPQAEISGRVRDKLLPGSSPGCRNPRKSPPHPETPSGGSRTQGAVIRPPARPAGQPGPPPPPPLPPQPLEGRMSTSGMARLRVRLACPTAPVGYLL